MKKFITCAAIALTLSSCSLLNVQDGGTTGGPYQAHRNDNTMPPPSGQYNNGQYNNHQYNGNNGQHNNYQYNGNNGHYNSASQHVTQNAGTKPGQHVTQKQNGYDGYGNYNNTRQPMLGDIVPSLPSKSAKQVIINGETLFLCNGVYYKTVRTSQGTGYKIVGISNSR